MEAPSRFAGARRAAALRTARRCRCRSFATGSTAARGTRALAPGEVVLLENCRFNKGEKKDDEALARRMAKLCDVYVNDAFGTAHRAEATTHGIAKYAPVACAGPLLAAELDALGKALANPAAAARRDRRRAPRCRPSSRSCARSPRGRHADRRRRHRQHVHPRRRRAHRQVARRSRPRGRGARRSSTSSRARSRSRSTRWSRRNSPRPRSRSSRPSRTSSADDLILDIGPQIDRRR